MEPRDDTQDTYCEEEASQRASAPSQESQNIELLQDDINTSENLFPESPVYDPPEEMDKPEDCEKLPNENGEKASNENNMGRDLSENTKRKLSDVFEGQSHKIPKLATVTSEVRTQVADDEVSQINTASTKRKLDEFCSSPSTSKVCMPVRSSPRKITKRSNSCPTCCDNIRPRMPRGRSDSVDLTKQKRAVRSPVQREQFILKSLSPIAASSHSDSSNSRPSVEFVREICPPSTKLPAIEETIDLNDSQNFHLQLSQSTTPDCTPHLEKIKNDKQERTKGGYNSEPIAAKDRGEILTPGKIHQPPSVGYDYSDQSNRNSQTLNLNDYHISKLQDRTTDQESTDSVSSMVLDSPENPPSSMATKLINKLSNGNSSTPTECIPPKHSVITISDNDSDSTPDANKNGHAQGKRFGSKADHHLFTTSNATTPSTISPLQNGHTLTLHTPSHPLFDIHIGHDEDGEFLSMYIVRTDNDLGADMCKEFQRVSKRFTIDPYLADVSKNNSPSSVTSAGIINLPVRTSFTSTVSASTSSGSNRTIDGAFIVPQPPGKSISNQGTTSVKGYKALRKKIDEIFSHITDACNTGERSNEDKISAGVQVSPGVMSEERHHNGSASPEEVSRCDRATPKSSLKKTKVKGRRPLAGKTKRAILPTQPEEPEYMHGMNSPEMIPSVCEKDKDMCPIKEPNDKGVLGNIVGTPKSLSKLKEKKRSAPVSPRPATPQEPPLPHEYEGHQPGTLVLAKWVDKRYYSGKVVEILEPNSKYLIEFDDGHTKALLDEFIIFGDARELPLAGQSVYALVDEEQNYEPGLVLAVEQNSRRTVTYRCTTDGDTTVSVTATELYMTEDQARSVKESRPRSPRSAPATPRRRAHRELDLDNIIHGPRSARGKGGRRVASPKSPKASTSGIKGLAGVGQPASGRKRRPVSECSEVSEVSEMSEGGGPAPAGRAPLEEVVGVEPEVQRTPRKIDGVKAGPLQLKGAAKQTVGKKNSKLNKFENDADTVSLLGPIPPPGSRLFAGLHFLLTCTDRPSRPPRPPRPRPHKLKVKYCLSEEDETGSTQPGTDHEDLEFSERPFHKERLREQLEAGGGTVYSHFEDVPRQHYAGTRLIAPRPCHSAKYILCLAADIRAVLHDWVIASCTRNTLCNFDAFYLSAGWSIMRECFIDWVPAVGRRSTSVFKDKVVVLCGDQETLVEFWERVCALLGAGTRTVTEDSPDLSGGLAVLAEWDCPHEVQNKANQDDVPLVSTTWVVQCLIEGRICPPAGHVRFSFNYAEPE